MIHTKKKIDGVQHWGYGKRFEYQPKVPKMGDKVKIEKKLIKPKKGGKNHVPGAGTY